MALSEQEQTLLEQIGGHMRQEDPRLAKLMDAPPPPGTAYRPAPAFRTPRAAFAIALALLASAVVLVAGIMMNSPQPTGTEYPQPSPTGHP